MLMSSALPSLLQHFPRHGGHLKQWWSRNHGANSRVPMNREICQSAQMVCGATGWKNTMNCWIVSSCFGDHGWDTLWLLLGEASLSPELWEEGCWCLKGCLIKSSSLYQGQNSQCSMRAANCSCSNFSFKVSASTTLMCVRLSIVQMQDMLI